MGLACTVGRDTTGSLCMYISDSNLHGPNQRWRASGCTVGACLQMLLQALLCVRWCEIRHCFHSSTRSCTKTGRLTGHTCLNHADRSSVHSPTPWTWHTSAHLHQHRYCNGLACSSAALSVLNAPGCICEFSVLLGQVLEGSNSSFNHRRAHLHQQGQPEQTLTDEAALARALHLSLMEVQHQEHGHVPGGGAQPAAAASTALRDTVPQNMQAMAPE